jgi:tetratricopeptide (TPR) repeat protein
MDSILEKCLEKHASDRYQHVDELVVDLRRLRRKTDSQTASQLSSAAAQAAKGERSRIIPYAVGAALAIVVLAIGFYSLDRGGGPTPASANAVAVMPLENLRDGPDEQRLGRVLQELIITDLSGHESLQILSSQRLTDIRKQIGAPDELDADVASEVARRAGAGHMLTGALSQLGDKYIVTCQVIDVGDGTIVGSQRVDGDDLYAMVDRLTTAIRNDLNLTAAKGDAETPVADKTTESIEAYGHFVRGTEALNELDWKTAVEELERAAEIDPLFGAAHLRLALARWWALEDESFWVDQDAPANALAAAVAEGSKLTGDERELAEAFLPLIRKEFEAARPVFEVLVAQHPDVKEAWYGYGEALYHGPKGSSLPETINAFRRALELDPDMHVARTHICDAYRNQGRHEEVIAEVKVFMARNPHHVTAPWPIDWIQALSALKRVDEIGAVVESSLAKMDGEESVKLLTNASRVLRSNGRDEEAHAMLVRALEIDDTQTRIYNTMAGNHRDDFDYRGAERRYREALAIDEESPGANQGLFDIMARERRYREAYQEATERIQRHPDFLQLYVERLGVAIPTGDEALIQEALDAAVANLTSDSQRRSLWARMGWRYKAVGDQVRALEYFNKALAIDNPIEELNIHLGLGWTSIDLRRFDDAIGWFTKAIAINERFGNAGLSAAYVGAGQPRRAVESIRAQLDLWGDVQVAWFHSLLVQALVVDGQLEVAEAELESAVSAIQAPRDVRNLLTMVVETYVAYGHLDEADAILKRALALDLPKKPRVAREEMQLAVLRGDWNAAAAASDRVLAIVPRDASILIDRASLDLARGDAVGAEKRMRAFLEEGPASADAFRTLAYSLCEQARFETALGSAERLMAMSPVAGSHDLLAWILIAGDLDVERGVELARRSLELSRMPGDESMAWPYEASAEHCLGLAAMKNGDYKAAIERLTAAAETRPQRKLITEHLAEAKERLASTAP